MKRIFVVVGCIILILTVVGIKHKQKLQGGTNQANNNYFSATSSINPNSNSTALKTLAANKNIEIGSALGGIKKLNDSSYMNIFLNQFNLLEVDGPPLNWGLFGGGLRPSKDTFNFAPADQIVQYAQDNNLKIQAHHLTWGVSESIPTWLKQGNFTNDQLLTILHNHITTVVSHYKGKIQEWTVANEVVSRGILKQDFGTRKPTSDFWYEKLGDQYVEQSFKWAKQADPNAQLILSDYTNEEINPTSNAQYDMIKRLLAVKTPIDGMGMQMHLDGANPPRKAEVIKNMKRFGDLGLNVYITEFDVDLTNVPGTQDEKYQVQAGIYKDMLEACLESGVCHSFTVFGFTDKATWYLLVGRFNAKPLLYDGNLIPKPAYYAVQHVLSQ